VYSGLYQAFLGQNVNRELFPERCFLALRVRSVTRLQVENCSLWLATLATAIANPRSRPTFGLAEKQSNWVGMDPTKAENATDDIG
jgi:hypothetical protein